MKKLRFSALLVVTLTSLSANAGLGEALLENAVKTGGTYLKKFAETQNQQPTEQQSASSRITSNEFSKGYLGNTQIESFDDAKKLLYGKVHRYKEDRVTLYCGAEYSQKRRVSLPEGFQTKSHQNRQSRVEAEHIVPAHTLAMHVPEWKNGHPSCVENGKSFKGRECAIKANNEFNRMQSDLFNLYPAIGSVNALRSNHKFGMLPHAKSDFGSCDMRIENKTAQPPEAARGIVARTHLYMDMVYPLFNLSKQQRQLMEAWDKQYPVTTIECTRLARIKPIQGNTNPILEARCKG
ncbi:TPA: endonuclease I [Vibrio vulnificus]|uniref:Endonuclease I n=1 Tax=Vibrio vulnificus TaxID=672 RepID=A0A8H9K5D7_VIBVL|nr:endonuclease [Vibrio vulnificus]HAS8538360.1 endonuclease I [Vibrio vulnificus]